MFSIEKVYALTGENVLQRVSDVSIYNRYFQVKGNRRAIQSPFREDKNPSFSFFFHSRTQALLWKDFGTGECGNVFSFLKKLFNIDYNKVLEMINSDFDLKLKEPTNIKFEKITTISNIGMPNKSQVKITWKEKSFDISDLTFINSWGILPQAINFICIASYSVNENAPVYSRPDNPIYGYVVEDRIKIYSPKSDIRKWVSTLKGTDFMVANKIPCDRKTLVITKSFKDAAVLNSMGYYAIAFQSESIIPKFEAYLGVREHPINKAMIDSENYKIAILYDNDSAGYKGAIALRDFILDNQQKLKWFVDVFIIRHSLNKDISDYTMKNGFEEAKLYIDNQITETLNWEIAKERQLIT